MKVTIAQKEIGLYYCLGAAKEMSKLMGGLDSIKEYMTGDAAEVVDRMAKLILIMNRWYAKAAACNGEQAEAVDADWLDLHMDLTEAGVYGAAIIEAINEGTQRSVEVKPIPQKNVKSGGSRKKSS